MSEDKSVLDKNAIEHFVNDVLKHLLPMARYKSAGFFGPAETVRATQISMELADSNEINMGSDYYYTKNYSFIHYTSVHALLSILKEKKIRLYNLQGMDDKEEFVVPLKHSQKALSEYEIKRIKKNIFCLSMCENGIETKEESLPQWRSYAQDGLGVGIVFKFNKRYSKDWVHFMLSRVYYNQKSLSKFSRVESLYNEFKIKYNLSITNFDEIFYKYFAFHKNGIYKSEKEVRLVYCKGFHSYEEPDIKYDFTKSNKKTSYVEVDLEWEWEEERRNFIIKQGIYPSNIYPKISIDKILLGYKLSKTAKSDLFDICKSHFKNFKNKPQIRESGLFKHFNER